MRSFNVHFRRSIRLTPDSSRTLRGIYTMLEEKRSLIAFRRNWEGKQMFSLGLCDKPGLYTTVSDLSRSGGVMASGGF